MISLKEEQGVMFPINKCPPADYTKKKKKNFFRGTLEKSAGEVFGQSKPCKPL